MEKLMHVLTAKHEDISRPKGDLTNKSISPPEECMGRDLVASSRSLT
jgi:hypothetical protein